MQTRTRGAIENPNGTPLMIEDPESQNEMNMVNDDPKQIIIKVKKIAFYVHMNALSFAKDEFPYRRIVTGAIFDQDSKSSLGTVILFSDAFGWENNTKPPPGPPRTWPRMEDAKRVIN